MKVLLKENIDKLGERGEIVDVANGYARNYLLPRSLAVTATETNFKQLEIERAKITKKIAAERIEQKAARDSIERTSCTVTATASPEGHLYGSVGPDEIAEALNSEGHKISPHDVKLEHPLKETGVFVVDIELAPDLLATTRVWVVAAEA